jgi:uncharacterized membrane protein
MAEVEESIDVDVPASRAYNQWTQFAEFPRFMENVESVRQIDDRHLHWVAEIAGRRYEWDAEITYQDPERHIAWRATEGKYNSGSVRFDPLGDDRTRMKVRMTWETEGVGESLGETVGVDDRGVRADLKRFKELVEARGDETRARRGRSEAAT